MIYRIGRGEKPPCVDLDGIEFDQDLHPVQPELGNMPFFLIQEIKPYADVWGTQHINFIIDGNGNYTDEFPDMDVAGCKLFLSEKAYDLFKDTFKDYGEFLPVTFNAGTGYIFNPLTTYPAIKDSLVYAFCENRPNQFKFDESLITAPIFKCDDVNTSTDIFISKDVYRTMRLNGLTGVWFYEDYGTMYSEPEGGYKDDNSMPGYGMD